MQALNSEFIPLMTEFKTILAHKQLIILLFLSKQNKIISPLKL